MSDTIDYKPAWEDCAKHFGRARKLISASGLGKNMVEALCDELEEARRILSATQMAGNKQNIALYESRPLGSREVQEKYLALDEWKKAHLKITTFLSK